MSKDHFLSISGFADYKGVSKSSVKRGIKNGEISIIKVRGSKGYRRNHPEIRVHFTELSKEAQEEFLQDRGLASKKKTLIAEDQKYLNLTQKQQNRFDENSQIIKIFLEASQDLPPGRKTAFTRQFANAHKISESKLRRLYKGYVRGSFEALIPNWKAGTQKRKFEDDKDAIKFVRETYLVELGPSKLETYQRYIKKFKEKGEDLFSYTTIADFINRNWSASERLLARNPDEWKKHHGIYVNRDWDQVAVNEIWFSDAKQVDVACLYDNKAIFPWLTVFMDARSRKFTGWVLTATPDKWAIAQAFDYGIAIHGVPKVVYTDRGKPYKSYYISGEKIKTRKAENLFQDIEKESFIGIFREMGCDIFFAYPRNAKEKIIEAAFGIFTDRLNYIPGWRSHKTMYRPSKLEREIKQKKILSFDELYREINKVIKERNAAFHSGTKKVPNDFYTNYTAIIPSDSIRAFLKMDRHFLKIRNGGVKIGEDFYRGKELWRHSGEVVEVRRDPANILKAAVIKGNTLLEIAHLEPKGHYRSLITLKNRETVAKLNQNIRRERKKLLAHEEEIFTNPDPRKVAMEMGGEVKLKSREIRPAASVTSLHQREKLARQTIAELEKDTEIDIERESAEMEIAAANKPSIWKRYVAATAKKRRGEAPKPRLRLIPREQLTMYKDDAD